LFQFYEQPLELLMRNFTQQLYKDRGGLFTYVVDGL